MISHRERNYYQPLYPKPVTSECAESRSFALHFPVKKFPSGDYLGQSCYFIWFVKVSLSANLILTPGILFPCYNESKQLVHFLNFVYSAQLVFPAPTPFFFLQTMPGSLCLATVWHVSLHFLNPQLFFTFMGWRILRIRLKCGFALPEG